MARRRRARPADGAGRRRRPAPADRDEPRPRRVHPRGRGRQGRDRGRARRSRSCSRGASRSSCRPTRHRRAARRDRAVPRAPPGQPEPVPVLRPDARLRGRRRVARSSSLQVEGDQLTTHPIAGTRPRGADARGGRPPRRAAPGRPQGTRRARDARRPRSQRPRPRRAAGHRDRRASTWRSSATATSCTSCRTSRRGSSPDLDALDALRSVFPAGTLSGAPKVRAMQLIAAAEGERRGLYGGAVGYLGYDGNLDTAITIRSAVLKDGQAHVHTGAGIVAGSRAGEGVRGDRAQGGGPPARDRARRGRRRRGARGAAATPAPTTAGPAREARAMILVIDNYDSFTFNLVQALQAAGAEVRVVRNDAIDTGGVEALADDPAADLRGIVDLARARATRTMPASRSAPIEVAADRRPAARRLPRDAVDGRGVRRVHRPGADPRPRRSLRGHPRRRRSARRACPPRSWPPAITRSRSTRRRCRPSCGSPR